MIEMNRPIVTHRRLLLFKWLMVFIPPITVAVGHGLLGHAVGLGHIPGGLAETLLVTSLVTALALVLAYMFVETLFSVLRRLQAEALAREQDILTMNAVMHERERLSRELHDGVAQLVAQLLVRLDTIKELVVAHLSNAAIAERLVVSEHAVKNHLKSILSKLHFRNRHQAAAYGVARGWLPHPKGRGEHPPFAPSPARK